MIKGRLSRDELEGLLALEAKGAARSLRDDSEDLPELEPEDRPSSSLLMLDRVSDLPLEPMFFEAEHRPSPSEPPSSRTEFGTSPRSRSRRGRLDLAAMLCEFAPHCRISIEPGSGTEVVGHENDLRRALQLMVLQDPAAGGQAVPRQVELRREGEWIRINVELGPDISVVNETERRWLHRVAIRHGGRFELRGSEQSLLLPADGSAHEVEALQRELEQAQLLGETYARELASAFSGGQEASGPGPLPAGAMEWLASLRPVIELAARELQALDAHAASLPVLRDLQTLLLRHKGSTQATAPVTAEQAAQGVQALIRQLSARSS